MDLKQRFSRTARREQYVLEFELPVAVEQKVRWRYPELTHGDWLRVEHGLREWLIICLHRRRSEVGMPSRVVDDAWHELILNTVAYTQLCECVYGSYLHHTPESGMATPLSEALDNSVLAWDRSRLSRNQFEATIWDLDDSLGIEDPYGIDPERRKLVREWPRGAGDGRDVWWWSTDAGGYTADGGGSGCAGGCGGGGCGGGGG